MESLNSTHLSTIPRRDEEELSKQGLDSFVPKHQDQTALDSYHLKTKKKKKRSKAAPNKKVRAKFQSLNHTSPVILEKESNIQRSIDDITFEGAIPQINLNKASL